MVNVPIQDSPSQTPSSAPTPLQQISTSPASFGGGFTEGLKDLGGAQEQRSDVLAAHAVAFQTINNKTESDAANTNYIKTQNNILFGDGTDANPGFYNLQGKNAVDAYPDTLQKLQTSRDDISNTMSNSASRLMFDADSRRLQQYSIMDASRHAAQQRKAYQTQISDTAVTTLQDQASLNYQNDDQFKNALNGIANLRMEQGAKDGAPLDSVRAIIQKDSSTAWSQRVLRMADQNSFDAERVYNQNQAQFTPQDRVKLDNFFHHTLPPIEAQGGAKAIIGGLYGVPQSADLYSAVEAQEGSGSGAVSSEGAVGRMQLEPGTAVQVAKELGQPLDVALFNGKGDEADAYNRKLGQQYLNDQMRRFNGNVALATAAYNAGPAVVSDWINGTNNSGKNASLTRLGDPSTGEISSEDWAKAIPFKETREYVAGSPTRPGILQRLGPQTPVTATSPDPKDHLADYLAQADRLAAYQHPGDALYAHALETQTKAQVTQISQEYRANVMTARNSLQTQLNGGEDGSQPKPTTIDQLYASYDGAKQDFAMLPATTQKGILNQLTVNSEGPKGATPKAQALYSGYLGMYHNDPEGFKNADLAGDTDLPWSMKKELLNKQQTLLSKPPPNEDINHAMSLAATAGFKEAGITKDNTDQYNAATGLMSQEIDRFNAIHNRRPNDSDIRNITQNILQAGKQQGWFGSSFDQEQAAKNASVIGGVPDAEAQKIVQSYRKNFGRNPTDGQISWWYSQSQRGRNQ